MSVPAEKLQTNDVDIQMVHLIGSINKLIKIGDFSSIDAMLRDTNFDEQEAIITFTLLRTTHVVRSRLHEWDFATYRAKAALKKASANWEVLMRGLFKA